MEHLWEFIKNPGYLRTSKIDWNDFFKIFICLFIAVIPLAIISQLFRWIFNIQDAGHDLSGFKTIIYVILMGPILEELIFRYILVPREYVLKSLIIFIIALALLILEKSILILWPIILVIIFMLVLIVSSPRNKRKAQRYLYMHYKSFFYGSAVLFGLLHISNIDNFSYSLLMIYPFTVLPHIAFGFAFGYIRIKYGIVFSILLHCMVNSIPTAIDLIKLISHS